jgi:hypothetical protein
MKLRWASTPGGRWPNLNSLVPNQVQEKGVYLLFVQTGQGHLSVFYAGEGHIGNRLGCHRRDERLEPYWAQGPLLATWAETDKLSGLMIERYLTDLFQPPFGSRRLIRGLPVNLPFQSGRCA